MVHKLFSFYHPDADIPSKRVIAEMWCTRALSSSVMLMQIFLQDVLSDWYMASPRELVNGAFQRDEQCAVLVYPYLTLGLGEDHFSLLHPLLQRPAGIRRIASHVWQRFMKGQKYLAIHYRFNAEWAHAW